MGGSIAMEGPLDTTATPCIVPGSLVQGETVRSRGLWATLSKHIMVILAVATLSCIVFGVSGQTGAPDNRCSRSVLAVGGDCGSHLLEQYEQGGTSTSHSVPSVRPHLLSHNTEHIDGGCGVHGLVFAL